MPKYLYHAYYRQQQEHIKGIMEATNPQQVATYLQNKNCIILQIKPLPWYYQLKQLTHKSTLKTKDIALLCKELALMLAAGLTLVKAFNLLEESEPKLRPLLSNTLTQLKAGNPLSSIWQQEKAIPPYVVSAIKVAEHTGLLSQALEESSLYLEKKIARKEKLQQLTFYPLMLFTMLNILLAIMLLKVVPTFKTVFQDMEMEIPSLTKLLFILSDLAVNYSGFLLLSFLLIAFTSPYLLKSQQSQKLFRYLPLSQQLWEKIWLIDFSSQLLLLYNAGIPLEESLKVIADVTTIPYFKKRIITIHLAIEQGKSFSLACLSGGITQPIFIQLLKVGEETGNLNQTLTYSNKFLQQEVDKLINRLMSMLEPVLILLVGLLMGLFIFALIVPLFDLPATIGV